LAADFEADFARLLRLLTARTEQIDLMTELGIQAARSTLPTDEIDLEAQKLAAIARCRRQIEAARHLYLEGDLSREEYSRRKDRNEREIAHWETRTTDTEKVALEIAMCVEAIDRIADLWDLSDDEDRQGMVRSLFSYIVYNLDTHRIVDFRLKPWADRFVMLRAALYNDGEKEIAPEEFQGRGQAVAPTGYAPLPRYFALPYYCSACTEQTRSRLRRPE
jgi:hypothetical protein